MNFNFFNLRSLIAASVVAASVGAGSATAAVIGFEGLDADPSQPIPLQSFSEGGFSFDLGWTGPSDGPAIFNTYCRNGPGDSGTAYGGSDGCNGDLDLVPSSDGPINGANPIDPADQGVNGILGNILILQENGTNTTPNDEGSMGSVTFTVTGGPGFIFKGFSAVDDGRFTAKVGNVVLGTVNNGSGAANDNRTGTVAFS